MWQMLLNSLLGGGEKPGQESQQMAQQGQGAQPDAFAGLLQQLMGQQNPDQSMRRKQMQQQLMQNDPFSALLGM